jgi:diacylglycerol kinase family enzyme
MTSPLRALLIYNPRATAADDRVRDVVTAALRSCTDLAIIPTKQRGHATAITAGAVHEGVEAVFALGGDGTVNEVIQALAGTPVKFGAIPGGGANVFARALGLPNDPVAATAVAVDRLRAGRTRPVTLGIAAGRYFGFNAGFGFDAAVVRTLEQRDHLKRRLGQLAFVWLATRQWFTDEHVRDPGIELVLPDGARVGPFGITMIGNADPYTFLGRRRLRATPRATFEEGLDVMAIDAVGTVGLLRILAGAFANGRHVASAHVTSWHDLPTFVLRSPRPLPLMVDGDYAGEHDEVTFEAASDALQVLA